MIGYGDRVRTQQEACVLFNTTHSDRMRKNKEFISTIKERKLQLIGHMRGNRYEILWLKIEEKNQGKRSVGRNKIRSSKIYTDDLVEPHQKFLGLLFHELQYLFGPPTFERRKARKYLEIRYFTDSYWDTTSQHCSQYFFHNIHE